MKSEKLSSSDAVLKRRLFVSLLIAALALPAANKLFLGGAANALQFFANSYESAAGIVAYRALTLISSIVDSCAMCVCACLLGYSLIMLGASYSVKQIIIIALSPIVSFAVALFTLYLLVCLGIHDLTLSALRDSLPYYALSAFFSAAMYYFFALIGVVVFFLICRKKNKNDSLKKSITVCAATAGAISLFSSAADIIVFVRDNYIDSVFNFILSYIIIPLFCAAAIFFLVIFVSGPIFEALTKSKKEKEKAKNK